MASVNPGQTYIAPTCEDYHTDDSDHPHVAESFPRRASPSAANVTAKRSHPSDLNTDKPSPKPPTCDLRSDSGYSSYTVASKSSANSAASQPSRSPPVAAAPSQPTSTKFVLVSNTPNHGSLPASRSPHPLPRRPTLTTSDSRQRPSDSARPTPLTRTSSSATRRVPDQQHKEPRRRPTVSRNNGSEECNDPNCTSCPPPVRPQPQVRTRPEPRPARPSREASLASDQLSHRSDPVAYYSTPPSPSFGRRPAPYVQGPALVQPGQSTRRRRSSMTGQRPLSFHGGDPSTAHRMPGGPAHYPSTSQDYGPPPAMSAYMQPFPPTYGAMGPPPLPNNYYPPAHPTPPPPAFEQPRPPMTARGSNFGTRGVPAPAPIVTQTREPPANGNYSARYAPPATPREQPTKALIRPKLVQAHAHQDVSSDEYESSSEEEEYPFDPREAVHERSSREVRALESAARAQAPRARSVRRPELRHAQTDQIVDQRRQSIVLNERPRREERERERERVERERERERLTRVSTAPPARRPSVSRPPMPQRQVQSEYDTRNARVLVNNSRTGRRQSYQGGGGVYDYAAAEFEARQKEQRRANRASRVYEQVLEPPEYFSEDEEIEEEQPAPIVTRPRRTMTTESRRPRERAPEPKTKRVENDAEEYIKSTRGSRDTYTDQVNRAARRASRIPSGGPSRSGSSESEKASQSNRTTVTGNGNNGIRLRLDGSAPLSLSFNGDIQGQTLQLIPGENGTTDLVIGGSGGTETTYRSERGSVSASNRRSTVGSQARRDAEEASERSVHRSERRQNRESREERPHVLRRSRHTTYHQG